MHNLQTASTDLLRVVTGSAADLDCVVSFLEASQASPPVPDWPETQFTNIVTATTTTILAAPNASSIRKIKGVSIVNTHASVSTTVRVIIERTGPVNWDLFNTVTLAAGESLTFTEGLGWFHNKPTASVPVGSTNKSTASQAFSTTDAYVTGSSVTLAALGTPVVGLMYDCSFDMVKTAGTGAMVVIVRVGTAGTTSDTARLTFTLDAGTSAADVATFVVRAMFRTVGAGTSAVLQGRITMANSGLTATGFRDASPTLGIQQVTSGGFDSTVANSVIGVSFNGQTAFSGTAQLVEAELVKR
jgi:hypothetical protein